MKLFGQELNVIRNQVLALIWNISNWGLSLVPLAVFRPKRLPAPMTAASDLPAICIAIPGPGGLDQLQLTDIQGGVATVGYNIPGISPPFVRSDTPPDKIYAPTHVLVQNEYFSVNYADVTIRWGLYESALQYVGWPIVPGFDFSGTVIWAGIESGFNKGDKVFGFTMFGSYSSRILVPCAQIRRVPSNIDTATAAAIPAVAGTALHALNLAGGWMPPASTPSPAAVLQNNAMLVRNRAVLIHSAAGGVGSMLIQMCKWAGFGPVVAVVGASHKVATCTQLGADVVIDKAQLRKQGIDLNEAIEKASRQDKDKGDGSSGSGSGSGSGYVAIFDANGVESIAQSFEHLCRCGRLIIYGFHSNLPMGVHALSPMRWLKMIYAMLSMPHFDPMAMVLQSKAVLGFNLSFFADEHALIDAYLQQIVDWVESGAITVAEVTVVEMKDIAVAHRLIQSGQSVGKIVLKCPVPTAG